MTVSVSPNGRNHYETATPSNELLVATFEGIVSFTRSGPGAAWGESSRSLAGKHIASILVEPKSGTIFAAPTYLFLITAFGMLGVGLFRIATGSLVADEAATAAALESWQESGMVEAFSALLVLRAFAQGCAALTGTEAISNGVPAFKRPEAKNASSRMPGANSPTSWPRLSELVSTKRMSFCSRT